MTKIPGIVYNATLRTYRPQEKNPLLSKSKAPAWLDFDKNITPAKILSNLSVRGFLKKQEEYRLQIVDYNQCSQELGKSANNLTDEYFLEQKKIIIDTETTDSPNAFYQASAGTRAKPAQYDLTVSQMASFQANDSRIFVKKESKPLAAGIYTLGIKTGYRKENQVSAYIAEKDNLNRVIQKFANMVNAAGLEIAAQIKETPEEIRLHFRSKNTGMDNSFTVRDINGNAAEILGLNNVSQYATNTVYNVNGINNESPDNTILLDDGNVVLNVTGEINGAKITVASDYDQIINEVNQFANQYNKLRDILTDSDNVSDKGKNLLSGMKTLIDRVKRDEFGDIGLGIDNYTGLMEVDKDKLLKAITNNPDQVKSLFSDKPGLGSLTKSLAKTTGENPLTSFVKAPTMLDSIDYGWRWRNIGSLGIIDMGSFAAFNQGMFFDIFV